MSAQSVPRPSPANVAPARNIELKARLADLARARDTAARLGARPLGILRQVDTYFTCAQGRLKLRQIDDREACLIAYERPDRADAKASDYHLVPVADADALLAALSVACGVVAVVAKRRELWMYENVRIHLDDVAELGSFLEFEAVLGPDHDDRQGESQLALLRAAFEIPNSDLLARSYVDLLLAERASRAC